MGLLTKRSAVRILSPQSLAVLVALSNCKRTLSRSNSTGLKRIVQRGLNPLRTMSRNPPLSLRTIRARGVRRPCAIHPKVALLHAHHFARFDGDMGRRR